MTPFLSTIITPHGKVFAEEITSLIVPGADGELGVLARHAPMVVILKRGAVQIVREARKSFYALDSGLLEVNEEGEALILADRLQAANDLPLARQKAREMD